MARGKMKSLHGLYKALGKDRFLELAQHYSNHVRDTVEGTLNEMERRWYDADHTLTEAEKMVEDYNRGLLPGQREALSSADMGQAEQSLGMDGGTQ